LKTNVEKENESKKKELEDVASIYLKEIDELKKTILHLEN
jgi:hypothetical protein